jgi:hypothetical protein
MRRLGHPTAKDRTPTGPGSSATIGLDITAAVCHGPSIGARRGLERKKLAPFSAAVLVYPLISVWLVAATGWARHVTTRKRERRAAPPASDRPVDLRR